MTEAKFIYQNKQKWEELELLLDDKHKDADRLKELFIKVSSDLSYARTYFPNRSVRLYLNDLVQRVFDLMGKKQSSFGIQSIKEFFSQILPYEIFRQRKYFILSFLIFAFSIGIGIFSSVKNPEFARTILGDSYIDQTEENINKGDPMAIYKDPDTVDMFLGITINNIRVALIAFVLGLFGGLGTVVLLISNGVMLGAFQYFFYSKGLFLTSFLTIWIHGTIEISAIIIAGAAGLILGSGILFPGTYSRSTSLQLSAKRAARIVLGTVPLFIIAGLLESFVTRHTQFHELIKWAIILGSLAFIVGLYVIYPIFFEKYIRSEEMDLEATQEESKEFNFSKFTFRTFGQNIALALGQFRDYFNFNLGTVIPKLMIPALLLFGFIVKTSFADGSYPLNQTPSLINIFHNQWLGFILYWVLLTSSLIAAIAYYHNMPVRENLDLYVRKYIPITALAMLPIVLFISSIGMAMKIILLFFIPIQIILVIINSSIQRKKFSISLWKSIRFSYANFIHFIFPLLISVAIFSMVYLLINSPGLGFLSDFFHWHNPFGNTLSNSLYLSNILMLLFTLIFLPLIYFMYSNIYYSLICRDESTDLKIKVQSFGSESKVFEA